MIGFSKATYMYWQKRFDREDPDESLIKQMQSIRDEHKDYGYLGLFEGKKCIAWYPECAQQ